MLIDVDVITCRESTYDEYAIFETGTEHCIFLGYEDKFSFGKEMRNMCKVRGYIILNEEEADSSIPYDRYSWNQYRKKKLNKKKLNKKNLKNEKN